jgi:hypothetical protein
MLSNLTKVIIFDNIHYMKWSIEFYNEKVENETLLELHI